MACEDGQEAHLLGLARISIGRIDNLRKDFGEIGDTRLTVMAALTVADELTDAGDKLSVSRRSSPAARSAGGLRRARQSDPGGSRGGAERGCRAYRESDARLNQSLGEGGGPSEESIAASIAMVALRCWRSWHARRRAQASRAAHWSSWFAMPSRRLPGNNDPGLNDAGRKRAAEAQGRCCAMPRSRRSSRRLPADAGDRRAACRLAIGPQMVRCESRTRRGTLPRCGGGAQSPRCGAGRRPQQYRARLIGAWVGRSCGPVRRPSTACSR